VHGTASCQRAQGLEFAGSRFIENNRFIICLHLAVTVRLDVMYPEKYKKVVFSIFFIHYV
jgi:hypothetical protein